MENKENFDSVAEEATNKSEEMTGKVTDIDTVDDGKAHFELKVLYQKKVGQNYPVRQLIIKEANMETEKVQEKYTIIVRDSETAVETVRILDDLAFKNAVYDEVKIKIKEVKRIRRLVFLFL